MKNNQRKKSTMICALNDACDCLSKLAQQYATRPNNLRVKIHKMLLNECIVEKPIYITIHCACL